MLEDISNDHTFDGMQNIVKAQDLEPLSQEDGYRWGLSHIEYVKKELLKLEERALTRHEVGLLYSIVSSKLRAVEVEQELRKKLADIT